MNTRGLDDVYEEPELRKIGLLRNCRPAPCQATCRGDRDRAATGEPGLRVWPTPLMVHNRCMGVRAATKKGAVEPMCYTRRDRGLEEEARRLRAEEDRRKRAESKPAEKERDKTLTEKAKEMVGAR